MPVLKSQQTYRPKKSTPDDNYHINRYNMIWDRYKVLISHAVKNILDLPKGKGWRLQHKFNLKIMPMCCQGKIRNSEIPLAFFSSVNIPFPQ